MSTQYKRIETRTVSGIEQAERLQAQGWKVIQPGLFSVLMEKQDVKTPKKRSGFTKGSGCYTCIGCGKKTRDDGNGDSVHCQLCTKCYEEAGLENQHQDGEHHEHVEGCPMCRKAAENLAG